jgi:hypothetical protein
MRYLNKLPAVIALVTFAGCATTPDVHSPGDTSARIGSSETFALIPVAVDPKVSTVVASAAVEAAETGARDTLQALGYSETSREKADLVFYLHGKSLAPIAVSDWDYQPAPSQFGLSPHDVEAWSNHRIYVETYDNHSKQQIWMGWIECSCAGVNPERIQHEIQRIVATFPPRAKA